MIHPSLFFGRKNTEPITRIYGCYLFVLKIMKTKTLIILFCISAVSFLSGCASNSGRSLTNSDYFGPASGQVVGHAVGSVLGNFGGFVLGSFEGVANGFSAPFNNDVQFVRHWETSVLSDGRTIRVPVEIKIDSFGRPI